MDVGAKIGYIFLDLLLPILVGYGLRRTALEARFFDRLIELALVVVYPLLGVLSFWGIRITPDLLWLLVFGVLLHAVPGLLAYGRVKQKYTAPADEGSYLLAGILSNHLTLGGLSVYILFGPTAFAYVQLASVPQSFILFLFCFPLAQYYQRCSSGVCTEQRVSWRKILLHRNQVGIVGVLLGMALNGTGLTRPAAVVPVFDLLVHAGAWLSLLPVGHSVDFAAMRRHWLATWDMGVIKFLATPLIVGAAGALLLEEKLMRDTLLVLACAPVAINAVITVRLHRLNLPSVMANFVATTTIYLLIVYPLLFWWLR